MAPCSKAADNNSTPDDILFKNPIHASTSAEPSSGVSTLGEQISSISQYQPCRTRCQQVTNACTNCQQAHKKCDNNRPCYRCTYYHLEESCINTTRKEREKGIKRGPYKKRKQPSERTLCKLCIYESLNIWQIGNDKAEPDVHEHAQSSDSMMVHMGSSVPNPPPTALPAFYSSSPTSSSLIQQPASYFHPMLSGPYNRVYTAPFYIPHFLPPPPTVIGQNTYVLLPLPPSLHDTAVTSYLTVPSYLSLRETDTSSSEVGSAIVEDTKS